MKVYYVTEVLTHNGEENACGIYTTEQKAKDAILTRVAQEYTPEEMEQFHFDENNEYVTETNEWIFGCTYTIDEIETDKELG